MQELLFKKLADVNSEELGKLENTIRPLQAKAEKFTVAWNEREKSRKEAEQIASWIQDRYYWSDVLTDVHGVMLQVESETSGTLHTATGVWIETFLTDLNPDPGPGGLLSLNGMPQQPPDPTVPRPKPAAPNTVDSIEVMCRAVNLSAYFRAVSEHGHRVRHGARAEG